MGDVASLPPADRVRLIAYAKAVVASVINDEPLPRWDEDEAVVFLLSQLALLLIDRGQRLASSHHALVTYATAVRNKQGEPLAWKALRAEALRQLALEDADEAKEQTDAQTQ